MFLDGILCYSTLVLEDMIIPIAAKLVPDIESTLPDEIIRYPQRLLPT